MLAALSTAPLPILGQVVLLAPAVHLKNQISPLVTAIHNFGLLNYLGDKEFMSHGWFYSSVGTRMCSLFSFICKGFIGLIEDQDISHDNTSRFDVVAGHDPSGTSI